MEAGRRRRLARTGRRGETVIRSRRPRPAAPAHQLDHTIRLPVPEQATARQPCGLPEPPRSIPGGRRSTAAVSECSGRLPETHVQPCSPPRKLLQGPPRPLGDTIANVARIGGVRAVYSRPGHRKRGRSWGRGLRPCRCCGSALSHSPARRYAYPIRAHRSCLVGHSLQGDAILVERPFEVHPSQIVCEPHRDMRLGQVLVQPKAPRLGRPLPQQLFRGIEAEPPQGA